MSMETKEYFDQNGYVVVDNVLSLEDCNQLTDYMFKLYDEKKLEKDDQCPLSDSIYGDPVFDGLLQKFAEGIGYHVGKELLPTYTYARIYRTGEILEPHIDRPACEFSATLTLGYDAKQVWPIFFGDDDIPVVLEKGEMALYKGCEVLHWRPEFKGNWHIQVFFHYVDANGPYAGEHIDGRSAFGTNKSEKEDYQQVDKQKATFKINKPILNGVMIPNDDRNCPGVVSINSNYLPELMFTNEECDKIISLTEQIYSTDAAIGPGNDISSAKKVRNIREALIFALDNDEENRWIFEKLAAIVAIANSNYYKYEIMGITHALQLIHYKTGDINGHYDWHVDFGHGESSTRKISVVVQLSNPDEYENCELIINNNGEYFTASKEKGSVHLFPSYMYHKVTPIEKGNRFSLVSWIHGSERFR